MLRWYLVVSMIMDHLVGIFIAVLIMQMLGTKYRLFLNLLLSIGYGHDPALMILKGQVDLKDAL